MTVEAARRTAAAERATPIWMRLPVAQVAYYAVLAFAVLFLMAPMIVLIMLSFTSSEWLSFPPKCCSVKWYGRAVAAPGFVDALILSVQLATIVTICSLILGIAAALGIARGTFRGRGLLLMALMSPLVVPSIVTGLAMFQLFFITGLRVPFWNLVIGHVVITLPY
ncbi:MAG: hypothetical protein HY329_21600, partial [Chloroflexi bacterium]|nr:hypothetical protein [Chloroflexota bacterium]